MTDGPTPTPDYTVAVSDDVAFGVSMGFAFLRDRYEDGEVSVPSDAVDAVARAIRAVADGAEDSVIVGEGRDTLTVRRDGDMVRLDNPMVHGGGYSFDVGQAEDVAAGMTAGPPAAPTP